MFMPDDGAPVDSKLQGGPLLCPPANGAQKADAVARSHPVKVLIESYPEHRGLLVTDFLNPRGLLRWPQAFGRTGWISGTSE